MGVSGLSCFKRKDRYTLIQDHYPRRIRVVIIISLTSAFPLASKASRISQPVSASLPPLQERLQAQHAIMTEPIPSHPPNLIFLHG